MPLITNEAVSTGFFATTVQPTNISKTVTGINRKKILLTN
jgi:hypothetical protein